MNEGKSSGIIKRMNDQPKGRSIERSNTCINKRTYERTNKRMNERKTEVMDELLLYKQNSLILLVGEYLLPMRPDPIAGDMKLVRGTSVHCMHSTSMAEVR